MTIVANFLIFSLLIFVSDALMRLSIVRMERRVGLSGRPLALLLNILPSYMRSILAIAFIFFAAQFMYLGIPDKVFLAAAPLLMIFITMLRMDSRSYTSGITSSSYFLSLFICVLTAQSTGALNPVTHNPFSFISFLTAMFSIAMMNGHENTKGASSIARALALNIYMTSIFMTGIHFIYAAVVALALLYLQFMLRKSYPRLNLFHSMRQSLTLVLTSSVICFIASLMWVTFISGGAAR